MNTPQATPCIGSGAHDGRTRQVIAMVTEAERTQLEAIAQLEMRSLSATTRMLVLRGIEQYHAETAAAEAQ